MLNVKDKNVKPNWQLNSTLSAFTRSKRVNRTHRSWYSNEWESITSVLNSQIVTEIMCLWRDNVYRTIDFFRSLCPHHDMPKNWRRGSHCALPSLVPVTYCSNQKGFLRANIYCMHHAEHVAFNQTAHYPCELYLITIAALHLSETLALLNRAHLLKININETDVYDCRDNGQPSERPIVACWKNHKSPRHSLRYLRRSFIPHKCTHHKAGKKNLHRHSPQKIRLSRYVWSSRKLIRNVF